MFTYFAPLRRKIGEVVLVLACATTSVFLRSRCVLDLVMFSTGRDSMIMFVSRDNGFTCVRWNLPFDEPPNWQTVPLSDPLDPAHCYDNLIDKDGKSPSQSFCIGPTSYWWIIVPLTLLSAWLLLSRMRAAKPPASTPASS